ncbi:MAG TPA: Uma2 family endonuclease [Gemmataceae bacterium]
MGIATEPAAPETVAELLDRFGYVPPERILLRPSPATEADVLRLMEAPRKRLCELIDGVLVEKPTGFNESTLAGYLYVLLDNFIRPRNLGLLTTPDGSIRRFPGRVRIPDVAFVSWDRLPGRRRPAEPIPDLVPDLAVEVLSASNTAEEMRRKREEYFRAGVRPVWEIDPAARTATVYTAPDRGNTLGEADSLDGGEVLPGFRLPLRELFAELDRQG